MHTVVMRNSRRTIRILLIPVLMGVFMVSAGVASAALIAPGDRAVWATDTAGAETTSSSPTDQIVQLTNAERDKAGCAALHVDSRLTSAAQSHAIDMATKDYLSHTSMDGRTFDQRIRAAEYSSPAAENIATGQAIPSEVMQDWMQSAGHRRNIVNCSIKAIGVGYDSRGNYWTQSFGY